MPVANERGSHFRVNAPAVQNAASTKKLNSNSLARMVVYSIKSGHRASNHAVIVAGNRDNRKIVKIIEEICCRCQKAETDKGNRKTLPGRTIKNQMRSDERHYEKAVFSPLVHAQCLRENFNPAAGMQEDPVKIIKMFDLF